MLTYFWTDFEERLLPKYATNGRSTAEVGRLLGRSQRAVIEKAKALKISFHGKPGAPKGNKNASRSRSQWRVW